MEEEEKHLEVPTVNHMVVALGLDMQDWVNKESIRLHRANVFANTPQLMTYYPEWLDGVQFSCPAGHRFTPRWLEKRFPITPFRDKAGLLLRMSEVNVGCTKCDQQVGIPLPRAKFSGNVELYGDEATRVIKGPTSQEKLAMTYSIVSRPRRKEDCDSLLAAYGELKRKYLGSSDIRLHCKELFHEDQRKKIAPQVGVRAVTLLAEEVARLLADNHARGRLVMFNCAGVFSSRANMSGKTLQQIKESTYTPLVQNVIEQMTKQGLMPEFLFERTGADGWAKNLFVGGRLTLMWPFITNGLPVRTPEFVLPIHSPYLEFADLLSYAVADNIEKRGAACDARETPREPRIDLTLFGKVLYQGYERSGDSFSVYSVGYPWERFFHGTHWA